MSQVISLKSLQDRPLPMVSIVLAQQLVLLPLYFFVPIWITVICVLSASIIVWRERQLTFHIATWLKVLITLAAIAGVMVTFKQFSGREAGVALISAMYGLKILETKKPRDANLLLSLGFFMLVAGFLFSQKPIIAIYQFVPLVAILNALVAMHSIDRSQASRLSIARVFKSFAKYLLLALPIMIILFVFFPRLSGPIWRMPGEGSAGSGVSDTMSPGAIGNLQLSEEIALRVQFEGREPITSQSYWRVLTLADFDGFTWSRTKSRRIEDPGVVDSNTLKTAIAETVQLDELRSDQLNLNLPTDYFEYSITLEATRQNFLVTLDRPVTSPNQARLLEDFSSYSQYRILDRSRYTVISKPDLIVDSELSQQNKNHYTALPEFGNNRSRNWALQQRQLFNNDWDYIVDLLNQIFQKEYFYTLKPPLMSQDTIDSFWFDNKTGFCEHYAGALVFLARAAGIPARVVIGYQGGEKNPLSDYWIIRYANAHAWTEIWIEGRGWIRIDPTSAIAPQRIDIELLQEYRQREMMFDSTNFASAVELDDLGILKRAEYWMDQFNSRWNDWILDYNEQQQHQLFKNWGISRIGGHQLVIMMIVLVSVFLLFSSFKWFHQRRKSDPMARAFVSIQQRLAKKDIVQFDPTMGPKQLVQILSKQGVIRNHSLIQLLNEYIRLRYQQTRVDPKHIRAFLKKASRVRIVAIK